MDRKDLFILYCMAVASVKSLIKTIIAMGAFVCVAWLVEQIITEVCNG